MPHRRPWPLPLILALAALLVAPIAAAMQAASPATAPAVVLTAERPNMVLILTDDQDARSVAHMPHVRALLAKQGVTFSNFVVPTPACCPSRATLLRGQYPHNHGVLRNSPPNGGFSTFHALGREDSTVATWLQDAGYRTALLGKYLNGYPTGAAPTYVPPGWDEWYAFGAPPSLETGFYFDYTLNENGARVAFGRDPADYSTDVLSAKATAFIEHAAATGHPFFLYLAPFAPHGPATPAPRHAEAFADAQAPRVPSFNEADVTDKPEWARRQPQLAAEEVAALDARYRDRLRTLLAVDDLVAALVATLDVTGELENTYILFSSDNGFHLGEHRIPAGKGHPYEEAIRVPLIVRGPGVAAGEEVEALASNADLAPTIAALAGITPPGFVDGRSLTPLLAGEVMPPWRQAVLVENAQKGSEQRQSPAPHQAPRYRAVRTADLLYVEYVAGERELYDRRADPYELDNLAGEADPAFLEQLSRRLADLAECAAAGCHAAEDAPLDWPAS